MDASRSDGDPRRTTLGDLLYADRGRPRVSEKDWLRLVESIAAGDQYALRGLYERMHRVVFTVIVRITRDRETAEEVTLDVFHDVWRRASSYDASAGTVVAWIMNQARSRAIDRVRFEKRQKRANPHRGEPLREDAVRPCDEIRAAAVDVRRLRDTLAVLTPDERVAIETAFFSELTYAEVAERLDTPLGTIKTRIRSGLAKLRQALGAREQ